MDVNKILAVSVIILAIFGIVYTLSGKHEYYRSPSYAQMPIDTTNYKPFRDMGSDRLVPSHIQPYAH